MDVIRIDERGGVYLSPDIDDWSKIAEEKISAVIDLDGDLDAGVPTTPGGILYVYLPFRDDELPDIVKLHAVAEMAADLVTAGEKVLCHCLMGLNRSAFVAALILVHLGMSGAEALSMVRDRRPGALFNKVFAGYLSTLPEPGQRIHADQATHTIRLED